MPRFTLAEIMSALDKADAEYEVEPDEPLTAGWNHMQQSRGWK